MRKSYTAVEVVEIENTAYVNGVDVGLLQERERIIALLEDWIPDPHSESEECSDCQLIRDLIALIKGTVANNATVEPVGKIDKLGENNE